MIKDLESQIEKTKKNISDEEKNNANSQKKEFVYENIKKLPMYGSTPTKNIKI